VKGLLHPEADEEFAQAIQYYQAISPELGVRFYREIERLMMDVCEHPDRYHQFSPPARRHFSFEFPYSLIYVIRPNHVWIVAVMHMKREPGYWRKRL
jgi:plasmid stabilization system protein ParE